MAAYFLLNSGDRIGLNAGGALLLNAQDAEPPAPEPEIPPSLPIFTGGVGGFARRELSDRERDELLKRVRRSLGLDKDVPHKLEIRVAESPSLAGPVAAAAIQVRQAARAALETDDEEVVVLAAGWR
jgi:hypothetical protein